MNRVCSTTVTDTLA